MTNLEFKNTQKLGEKEYMTFLTGSELLTEWKNKKIEYIPEIQRGFKSVKDGQGNNILIPIYSAANVKKIKKHIEDNSFYVSQLTLNVLEGADILYDQDNKTLVVENAIIALSDGQHRIRALEEIDNQNKKEGNEKIIDLNKLIFPVKITNFNQEKAQEQFYQFTLGTKISSSRVEYFNNKDYSNKIVRELYINSVLSDKIETIKNNVSKKDEENIVSFATLKNAVELGFNTDRFESIEEVKDVSEYLKDFFKELFKVIPEFDNYEERVKLREENSLKCENFAFYGYLAIAEFLQHKDNWKELLPLLNEVNFDKTSNPWISRIIKKNTSKKKDKETMEEIKAITYSIINNNQSRKDIGNLMLKAFKKAIRNREVQKNEDSPINEVALENN